MTRTLIEVVLQVVVDERQWASVYGAGDAYDTAEAQRQRSLVAGVRDYVTNAIVESGAAHEQAIVRVDSEARGIDILQQVWVQRALNVIREQCEEFRTTDATRSRSTSKKKTKVDRERERVKLWEICCVLNDTDWQGVHTPTGAAMKLREIAADV